MLPAIAAISSESFIPAIAGKHNFDMLARQLRDVVGGKRRMIGKRLIVKSGEFCKKSCRFGVYSLFMMCGGKFSGHEAGAWQLVVFLLPKADRTSCDRVSG